MALPGLSHESGESPGRAMTWALILARRLGNILMNVCGARVVLPVC